MSLSNSNRIPLILENVDIFTYGESTLYGYDSLNDCLIFISLNELNNINDHSINRLHFSSIPTYPIKKLILNEDETILTLISDKTAYLVYLPKINRSPSKSSRLCPLNEIPPIESNSRSINNSLIDFLWLSSIHFLIVNSEPSSSECHLYIIRPSKHNEIEYIQTFFVGSSSTIKEKTKKISFSQSSDIVKLDLAKRKQEDLILILIFVMKTNGDIFIMEIEQNELINNEERILSSFVGPIRILPSTFDNYGADYSHSNLICLSYSEFVIVILTRNNCKINECIFMNPSKDEFYLFTINLINLPINEIKSMIIDKLNSNIYYILDYLSNIYLIEIFWINQIKLKENQFQSTNIQHLIKSNYLIQQFGLIQTNNKGQLLSFISKTQINQQKELIFVRPHSLLSISSLNSMSNKSRLSIELNKIDLSYSSEFINRIRRILHRDQSLPHLTLSSSSSTTNISNSDFEKNLIKFIKIFYEEYFEKQEKVRIELENKQRYLQDFQQTQLIANQELDQKFQQITETLQTLNQQYQQEYLRRKNLSSNIDDLLSVIEEHTPVVSNAEILMHQQLERYNIQINSLKEKIYLLKQFISTQNNLNKNQQHIEQSSMENFQIFVQYFKNEIDQMKQKFDTVNQND